MAEHGGHRTPSKPAPVSGPGSLSRRTDGKPGQRLAVPTGLAYGDAQALHAQESSSAMSQTQAPPPVNVPSAQPAGGGAPLSVTPFGAPTERPDEPITHGVDIGAGGGPEVLPLTAQPAYQQQGPMTQMLSQLAARDATGVLANLYQSALSAGA